jgi:class 3 adenylate cyclase
MGEIIPLRNDGAENPQSAPQVRTFLIADIRGYTDFTQRKGDEAAARLAVAFARLTREGVESRDGELLELRGDEALAVFTSTRQALRGAIDLQALYAGYSGDHPDEPLNVGIGIDAGEAVPVEGGYRGSALNMAARLCGAALASEILATEAVSHLAGQVEGLTYADGGRRPLKGMPEKVRVVRVLSGDVEPDSVQRPAVYREPTFPSIADFARGVGADEFTRDLGTTISEHLRAVNQQVREELARELGQSRDITRDERRSQAPIIDQMPQMQHLRELGRQIPGRQPAPVLARPPRRERTSPLPWIIAAILLLVVLAVAVILWTHVF